MHEIRILKACADHSYSFAFCMIAGLNNCLAVPVHLLMSLEKISFYGAMEAPQPSFHGLAPLYPPALNTGRESTAEGDK